MLEREPGRLVGGRRARPRPRARARCELYDGETQGARGALSGQSRHNDRVATATAIPASRLHGHHDRPSMVSVGTIIWLSSELMFFAALFASYFTIRAVSPELWAAEHRAAQRAVRDGQHHDPGAVLADLPARRVRRRARPGRPHRLAPQGQGLGPARVVRPHLRHGRDLHRRPGRRSTPSWSTRASRSRTRPTARCST